MLALTAAHAKTAAPLKLSKLNQIDWFFVFQTLSGGSFFYPENGKLRRLTVNFCGKNHFCYNTRTCFLEERMKKFFSALFAVFFALFLTSCIQNDNDVEDIEDFQTDNASYYIETEDEDFVPDEDVVEKVWDVTFSFSGVINDGNAENMINGAGQLTYINAVNSAVTVNSAAWAIKKNITVNDNHEVPMIQVFFADSASNADEDGKVTYFVLQLEGSSVSSRSETHYLNNDKLYETKVRLDDKEKIKEICYMREPDVSEGIVYIYTNNIRIGEELRVGGYADMKEMETQDCKMMN